MKKLTADVVVIGAGTAGMGAFRNALLHTQNVYLIENHTYGTTCARVGCMPSKLLIAAAERTAYRPVRRTFGQRFRASERQRSHGACKSRT